MVVKFRLGIYDVFLSFLKSSIQFRLDLRIELLEPEQNGPIVHTLYGLLMLLPQSEAFHTLRRRLDCVAHLRPFNDNRCFLSFLHNLIKLMLFHGTW